MTRKYSEIVLEGPFMMVKGFLLGFLAATKADGRYFFHRKAGIRRETLKGFLKEFFELDNYVHLCLEADLVDRFTDAAKLYTEITGNEIQSIKPINSASFSFAYEFYNESLAQKAKDILENLPKGVKLEDYFPYEQRIEEGVGIESYAPLHEYSSRGKGNALGDFEGILELYLKIKRSDISESVICSEVRLALD